MPSLGEAPSGGAQTFWLLLGRLLYGPDTWLTGVRGHGGHFSAKPASPGGHHALEHERRHEPKTRVCFLSKETRQ